MSERPREELLNDAALDREIEQALAVDPSPEFVARVRTRVAEDTTPRFDVRLVRWVVMGGATVAAAGVAATLYFGWSSPDRAVVRAPVDTARVQHTGRAGEQDQLPAPPETQEGTRTPRSKPDLRPLRVASALDAGVGAAREAFPEVMVSAFEVEGLRQLMSLTRTGIQIVEAPETGPLQDPEHMPEIVIEPITIEPIALVKMEGVAE